MILIRAWDGDIWLDLRLPGVPRVGDMVCWYRKEMIVDKVLWTDGGSYVEIWMKEPTDA